jgi:hypothetical protein
VAFFWRRLQPFKCHFGITPAPASGLKLPFRINYQCIAVMKKILLTLVIFALYGCNTTKIIDPAPTDIPPSLTTEDVYSAIMLSLQGIPGVTGSGQKAGQHEYEWMADDVNPENLSWHHEGQDGNVIHAGFYHERFYIRAEVTYTRDYINYALVESKNLKLDPELSHGKVYTWLSRLEGDVRMSLDKIDRYKRGQEHAG